MAGAQSAFEADVQREARARSARATAERRGRVADAAEEYHEAAADYQQKTAEAERAEADADRLRRQAAAADDHPNLP
ncbi:hypothetical protein [Mycolicibacterium vanbaalenii]|uniref:hypothetical protein n=1 Tax=Mycolicibacterium vanbaalenii TaxID=110539 RepID=UPI0023BA414A|nr:hypothetical protein [Mycolicibacterium vanbaalenii]